MSGTPQSRTVGLIWAQAANGVIGRAGALPWALPEDMAHFREVTAGSTVVMGRRTWESIPARFRPLAGRRNMVLTGDPSWAAPGAEAFPDLSGAIAAATGAVWVMGGARVYAAGMPLAHVLEITELADPFDGDVIAPEIGPGWQEVPRPDDGWHTSRTGLRYRFSRRTRRSAP